VYNGCICDPVTLPAFIYDKVSAKTIVTCVLNKKSFPCKMHTDSEFSVIMASFRLYDVASLFSEFSVIMASFRFYNVASLYFYWTVTNGIHDCASLIV
jgi:hypothetical protein